MEVLPPILRVIGEEKTTALLAYVENQSDSSACGSTTAEVHHLHYKESSNFCDTKAP